MHLDPTLGRSGPYSTLPPPGGHRRRARVLGTLVLAGATSAVAVAVPQAAYATVTSQVSVTTLQVASDAADAITVTCVGGQVKVNGADPGSGPAACSALTVLQVVGGPGNNVIDLSGVDPAAFTAIGSVLLDGREGDDTLTGTPLADLVIGGPDRDRLVAGRGGDLVLGGIADDVLVWNNGDGSDVMESGAGVDIVEVNGAVADADAFTVNPNGGRVRFDRTNLVPFNLDINETESLNVNGIGGNDSIEGAPGLAPLIDLTFSGGDGDDTLIGGDGDDTLIGNRGTDRKSGRAGADLMVWNNGDGSDLMEGEAGTDTVQVNGAVADADAFTVNPNGARVRFDRTNLVPFSLDIGTSENLAVSGNGGNDTITGAAGLAPLIDLTFSGGDGDDTLTGGDGDDVLAGGIGNDRITGFRGSDQMLGEAGEDLMVWNNGDGSDLIEGAAGTDVVEVNGAAADADAFTVNPNGARVRFDRTNLVPFSLDIGTSENLAVSGNGGNDTITGAAGLAPLIRLGFAGGDGDDTLTGGDGDDVLAGGIGNDRITGFRGSDQMLGEAGEDRMVWNNGDGSDLIEGAAGTDVVEVNGAETDGDRFTVIPNGGRVRFDRINLVPFRLDIASTEALELDSAGGDDDAVAAGGLKTLIDLAFTGGSGDDRFVGSNGDDLLRGGPGADRMSGAAGEDRLEGEGGEDRLDGGRGADRLDGAGARDRFTGGGGDDRIDARGQRLEPVNCGGGSDKVKADQLDLVRPNCEVVRR